MFPKVLSQDLLFLYNPLGDAVRLVRQKVQQLAISIADELSQLGRTYR